MTAIATTATDILSVAVAGLALAVSGLSFVSSRRDAKRARVSAEHAEERMLERDAEEAARKRPVVELLLHRVETTDDWPINNLMWAILSAKNVGPELARNVMFGVIWDEQEIPASDIRGPLRVSLRPGEDIQGNAYFPFADDEHHGRHDPEFTEEALKPWLRFEDQLGTEYEAAPPTPASR